MINRSLENQLITSLNRSPAVILIGPRQVGKTTLALDVAKNMPAIYLDLENRTDLAKVEDIRLFHQSNREKLIILDEVQRKPEVFSEIRGIIDIERRKGHKAGLFLFLGSASLDLLKQSSESLAGRTTLLELFPINALEYFPDDSESINRLWVRGGFPESLLADTDEDSLRWRQDFIRTYAERDIPLFGPRLASETILRFWTLLANSQSNTLNAAQFAKVLDVSQPTIKRYLDLLTDLLLVRQLQPWSSNLNKRLVRSPKIYIRDSGIVHALLNLRLFNDLLGHPVSGGSWEGFVIENIMSVLPHPISPYFYRSQAGAEVDLILEISSKEKWAIEIKRGMVPSVGKGFHIASQDIGSTKKFVVYAGRDTFPMRQDTRAISLQQMMEEVRRLL